MTKHLIRYSIVLLICLGYSKISFATHAFTMEIFYRWKQIPTSDSTYEFTVILERNCNGSTAGAPATLSIQAKSINLANTTNFNVTQLPTSGSGVPPLQPFGIYNCSKSTSLCIQEYYYRGDWTSPARANDWVFSTVLCDRPTSPNNPANLAAGCMWVECGLNNLDFPDSSSQNWSPIFHNNRPNHPGHTTDVIWNHMFKTICQGKFYPIDGSAKEYQGDSVVYSFYNPQTSNGNSLAYVSPFSLSNPLPSSSALTINPVTGIIPLVPGVPSGSGMYMVGVEAKEYRDDSLGTPKMIGYVRREMMIHINAPATCRIDSAHVKNHTLLTWNLDSTLNLYFHNGNAGNPDSRIKCSSLSPDGSEFFLVDSNYSPPRIIQVDSAYWTCAFDGFTDKVTLKLSAPVPCGYFWVFLQTGTDLDVIESECGYLEPAGPSGRIYTHSNVTANLRSDTSICGGSAFNIPLTTNSGPWSYLWNTNATTNSITANNLGTYWVEVTDKTCIASDTVHILFGAVSPPVDLGPDSMVCPQAAFSRILDAGNNRLSYEWSTNDTTSSIAVNAPGIYHVRVVDSNLCVDVDTIELFLEPIPKADLGPDIVLCEKGPFTRNLSVPAIYTSYMWSTGAGGPQISVNSTGTYRITVTSISNCTTKDTVEVLYDPSSPVSLGDDTVVCEHDTFSISLNVPGYKSYLWSNNSTSSSIMVNKTGEYWVETVNNFDCKTSDTILITSRNCFEGIEDNKYNSNISIYPNPVKENVIIEFTKSFDGVKVILFDLSGKEIQVHTYSNIIKAELNLDKVPSGLYFIQITADGERWQERIVKE